jgi:hypothetical protein
MIRLRIRVRRLPMRWVLAALSVLALVWVSIQPSNDRAWSKDQAVLPLTEVNGDSLVVRNVRNSSYRSTTDYDVRYEDRAYDLNKLKKAWYVVEPFSSFAGSAHTFLSFEFEGGVFLAVSVEIRKEQGEKFSAFKGLFKQYELMYVFGDERDLIKLRSNFRKDDVYLYPVKASPADVRALLVGMAARANELAAHPEFYNTLTNTCTTEILRRVNDVVPGRIPWSYKVLFPGYSDQLASEIGLLDIDFPPHMIRQYFRINSAAERFADAPDFSVKIREGLPPPRI